ncbi:hypothetical protein EVC26_041 [Rhizobium phage RHph_I72]|nr:hypothetical protein EVC26_041 [Rhizobium phage RHph_I72]
MVAVTNKHVGPLVIAGVEVRPGATAEVEDKKFEAWKGGNAAQIWMDKGLVVEGKGDGKVKKVAEPNLSTVTTGGTGDPSQSATGVAQGSNEDLAGAQKTRAEKLDQARALGHNPNNNISNAKLDEMIAQGKVGE